MSTTPAWVQTIVTLVKQVYIQLSHILFTVEVAFCNAYQDTKEKT